MLFLVTEEGAVYEQIAYEVSDPVATITLNRPGVLNAWTSLMASEFRDAVGRAEADRRVVGIVVTGAGNGFCAGADLKTLAAISDGTTGGGQVVPAAPEGPAGDPTWGEDLRGTYTYLMSVPKPVLMAINGAVAGMGVPIALSGDLRFMAEDAVLTLAFSQRGLVGEWGVTWLLPRLVGTGVALDLLFSSRRISGLEAASMGLVNRALPRAQVVPEAIRYVEDLARTTSPSSLAVMKRQVYQQMHAGLSRAEAEARELMIESFSRPDFAEGVRSFTERRPPSFGRLGD